MTPAEIERALELAQAVADSPHNGGDTEVVARAALHLSAEVARLDRLAKAERAYRVAQEDLAALGDAFSDRPSAEALAPHRVQARRRVDMARAELIAAGGTP